MTLFLLYGKQIQLANYIFEENNIIYVNNVNN